MKIEKTTYLRIGLLVITILISGMVFSSLAEDLVNRETLSMLDPVFGGWLIAHTSLSGDYVFSVITFFGDVLIISIGTGLLSFWLAKRKNWNNLVFLFSAVGGSALLNLVLKNVFQRTRPVFPLAFLAYTGYSFPSGHTMISLAFYGAVAYIALTYIKSRNWKILTVAGALVVSVLIGFSRLYLGVHYLTDVLAGWAAGGLWLAVCVLGDYWFQYSKLQKVGSR
ncbi:MAG: phosphatase PAP2 family protein [Anaerolineaceae bacterium]|nr:phosphatase PAP2 family protein [Anaerolineaceae bacterium]